MQTELSFILFMLLISSKESKRLGNCSRFNGHHFFWEPACKGWKRKPIEQKEAEL